MIKKYLFSTAFILIVFALGFCLSNFILLSSREILYSCISSVIYILVIIYILLKYKLSIFFSIPALTLIIINIILFIVIAPPALNSKVELSELILVWNMIYIPIPILILSSLLFIIGIFLSFFNKNNKNRNKGISTPIVMTIIIVLIVIVGGGILGYQYYYITSKEVPKLPQEEFETPEKETPKDETADWKTYKNEEYGFKMRFPNNFASTPIITVEECKYDNFLSDCPISDDIYEELNIKPTGPDNKDAKRIISDNIPVCIYHFADCGMGSCHLSYWYISSKNNKCLVVDIEGAGTTSCGVYGGDEKKIKECEERNVDTLQKLQKDIPSTFEFIEGPINECSYKGESSCVSGEVSSIVCGDYDNDGDLEWSSPIKCENPPTEKCGYGKCGTYESPANAFCNDKTGSCDYDCIFASYCESVVCTDSDGGKDYYKKGIVSWKDYKGKEFSQEDRCGNNNYFIEWYCQEDKPFFIEYKCPLGCENGACITSK